MLVAVPDGLQLAVTFPLARALKKMKSDKTLVMSVSAIEAMGSATTICIDKTGTLTLNQMTVVETYACGKKMHHPNNSSAFPPRLLSLLMEGIAQNTAGSVLLHEDGVSLEISGSATEKAILQWGVDLGMDFEAVRSESLILHAFPFCSDKKGGGVAVKNSNSEIYVHWKGAAEIVLASCSGYLDSNDNVMTMNSHQLSYYKKVVGNMASRGLRCIAIAYTICSNEQELGNWNLCEQGLVLLAIVGIEDPCQPCAKDAVESCTKAGIKVRLLTGDNIQTARAVALECGILDPDASATRRYVMEGSKFREMTKRERREVVQKIYVMGRASPNDKLLFVQTLKDMGHVVAVTGDGTNDASALQEADIKLAMGIQSKDVVKQNAQIIILDNFSSVVKVVRHGRALSANMLKFAEFQLSVYAGLIINQILQSFNDFSLNPVHLLWIKLIMDTLGALALATQLPTDDLMQRPPVKREDLMTNIALRNLAIQAVYQLAFLLVLNFAGLTILSQQLDYAEDDVIQVMNTLIFNAFVCFHVFNAFNARKPNEINIFKGVTENKLFMATVVFEVVSQVIFILILERFVFKVQLSWQLWLVSILIGVVSWPLAAMGKLIPVPRKQILCLENLTPMPVWFSRLLRDVGL